MTDHWWRSAPKKPERVGEIIGDEAGSTAMEYALVGSLISVAIIGALSATGSGVADKWNSFSATVVSYLR